MGKIEEIKIRQNERKKVLKAVEKAYKAHFMYFETSDLKPFLSISLDRVKELSAQGRWEGFCRWWLEKELGKMKYGDYKFSPLQQEKERKKK